MVTFDQEGQNTSLETLQSQICPLLIEKQNARKREPTCLNNMTSVYRIATRVDPYIVTTLAHIMVTSPTLTLTVSTLHPH